MTMFVQFLRLAAFRNRFGDDFCYIGNTSPDLPLLTSCQEPMVYSHPSRLWLLLPVLLLWISRLWLLASRGDLDEDPVVYAITDRCSLWLGALVVAAVLFAL